QRETKRRKGKRGENKSPLDGSDYHNLPALAAYIERVGAEQRNFRRFIIKREDREHYHHDWVVIQITKDHKTIYVTKDKKTIDDDDEYAPTKEELKAIEADLARATFPKSVGASESNLWDLKELIRSKGREPGEGPQAPFEESNKTQLLVFRDPSG